MTETPIKLAPDLSLPLTAATQTFAFLAKRGAGKTYAAGVLVEELLRAGVQVVVLDGVGVWYGLRLARNGTTRSAFEIPILGGHRADIALVPGAGALVAKTLVETRSSAVLDVSLFRKNGRKEFVTAFAEELLHLKKSDRSRLFFVVEEAQLYVPQRVQKGEERMLGAMEDLVKLGRNYGIGCALISQRPQAVNKDVLTQTEVLVCLQTSGAHERKAIKDWIVESDAGDAKVVDELPKLQVGEAFVWSPSWLRIFRRLKLGKKTTFDASATPTDDLGPETVGELGKVDLAALSEAMAEVQEEAAANDPKALRKRIAELEAELDEHVRGIREETEELAGHNEEEWRRLVDRVETLDQEAAELQKENAALRNIVDAFDAELVKVANAFEALARDATSGGAHVERARALVEGVGPGVTREPSTFEFSVAARDKRGHEMPLPTVATVTSSRPPAPRRQKPIAAKDGDGLKKGAREMLVVLAAYGRLSRRALSVLSNIVQGGTFSDYLSLLRRGEYVRDAGDIVEITPGGRNLAEELAGGVPTRLPAAAVLALHYPKLKKGARRMLEELVDVRKRNAGNAIGVPMISRDALSKRAGIVQGGTFSDYLSILRRRGLIDEDGSGNVQAADVIFGKNLV